MSYEYKDMYVDYNNMKKVIKEDAANTKIESETKKNLLNSQTKDRYSKKGERKDIFCTQCGQKQPNGAKFCFLCGEKLWKPEE